MDEIMNQSMEGLFNDMSQQFSQMLPETDVLESVENVRNFFLTDGTNQLWGDVNPGFSGITEMPGDNQLFSLSQLNDFGITGADALELMMTHEGTEHALQRMKTVLTPYQKELCSDFMAGFCAGMGDVNLSQMGSHLIGQQIDGSQPFGLFRAYALDEGQAFAHECQDKNLEEADFAACLQQFAETDSMQNGAIIDLLEERDGIESTFRHYIDMLADSALLEENLNDYKDTVEHCFDARLEYDKLSDKLLDGLKLRMGETTGSIGRSEKIGMVVRDETTGSIGRSETTGNVRYNDDNKSYSISFGSRESMLPYDEYTIYDAEHPQLNPFGIYAMCNSHGEFPPCDSFEKPYLPNDYTQEQLQEAVNKICDAAGIRHLPIIQTNDVPNAEFQSLIGPFRFTSFDDAIYLSPDYARSCIEKFGTTDILLIDLAHEIGHELNSLNCGVLSRVEDEKLADMFSGFMSEKMGIDIDLARQWNQWEEVYDPVGSENYPSSEERWDISAAGNYYSHFATVEDYLNALHDKHFLERVRDYRTDPVTILAQQEMDYQMNKSDGLTETLRSTLDAVKKYLLIERI